MKTTIYTAIAIFFVLLWFCSCKTVTQYVPIEKVKTEYRDIISRDSIYYKDSIYIRERGDTVFFTKYELRYIERLRHDSIAVRDSIPVPYPVPTPVNFVTGWQNFQIWLCRILVLLIGLWLVYKKVKN